MKELISIKDVTKKDENENLILDQLHATIAEGDFITIIGPSGSGKSTFLQLLNRMIDPDYGELRYKGSLYTDLDILKLRRSIGMVFQNPTMLKGSVRDNLSIGPSIHQETVSDKEIEELLLMVGLPIKLQASPAKTLSGGEKQRVALARTLANQPEILLLDEVTSSLDASSTKEIEELIQDIHMHKSKTIIWVTHNIEQAKRVGQYTWVFSEGRIVEKNLTAELFKDGKNSVTRKLLNQLEIRSKER